MATCRWCCTTDLPLFYCRFSLQSIAKWMGEEKIKKFVNYCLRYIADLDIPKKRSVLMSRYMYEVIN